MTGTGVGGRIRKQDVLDAATAQRQAEEEARRAAEPAPAASPAPAAEPARSAQPSAVPASVAAKRGTTERMSRLRRVIAQRMVESLQTSAQLTTVVEVDVTKIARLRDRAKRDFQAREGVKLSFLPFFAQAVVEALKIHPMVNASIDGEEITYHGQENLGIAVDTERGLLVPVIKDAGDLNIAGLARKIADLAERTRTNKIGPDELGGGTFTLTNTGSRGALFDTPIINQPQVAILGTGAVVRRPVVVEDPDGGETIAIRSMVYFALSYDHRLVDGADAARFLSTIKERLEDGSFESDLGSVRRAGRERGRDQPSAVGAGSRTGCRDGLRGHRCLRADRPSARRSPAPAGARRTPPRPQSRGPETGRRLLGPVIRRRRPGRAQRGRRRREPGRCRHRRPPLDRVLPAHDPRVPGAEHPHHRAGDEPAAADAARAGQRLCRSGGTATAAASC